MATTFFAITTGFFVAATVVAVGFFVTTVVAAAVFVVVLSGSFAIGLFVVATETGFTTVEVTVFAFEVCFADAAVLAGEGGVVATETGGEIFAIL